MLHPVSAATTVVGPEYTESSVPAIAPETPRAVRAGPDARTSSFLGVVPDTTKPAIMMLDPVRTSPRVERLLRTPSLNVPPETLAAKMVPPGPPDSAAVMKRLAGLTVPLIELPPTVVTVNAP